MYSTVITMYLHVLYRILELGFGKEIEAILDLLGSRKNGHVGKENADSYNSKPKRQNVLLSATLNEKVNHLAKISLENPVMIGLDDKKIQPVLSFKGLGSNVNDEFEHPVKSTSPSIGDFRVPDQLVQRYVKGIC
jgi:ATP-dependent RNA helicase DDX31/DBP7